MTLEYEEEKGTTTVPEFLHHTSLTVLDNQGHTELGNPHIYVLGSHTTVKAAKSFASRVLSLLGYDKGEFEVYEEKSHGHESWKHDDGIVIHALTGRNQELFVGIDTKVNTEKLESRPDGSIVFPHGANHLHYVLQRTIDYTSPHKLTTEIQGAYLKKSDAVAMAKECLISDDTTPKDYAQYDERKGIGPQEDWPFGDKAVVHAVSMSGVNFLIILETPPKACLPPMSGDHWLQMQ